MKYLYIFIFLFILNIDNVYANNLYNYVITPKGVYFYTQTTDEWNLLHDKFLKCENYENKKILDPNGGRGLLIKSCSNHRSPIEKRWIKTYSLDQSNWSCQYKGMERRMLVLICPKIYNDNENYINNINNNNIIN